MFLNVMDQFTHMGLNWLKRYENEPKVRIWFCILSSELV